MIFFLYFPIIFIINFLTHSTRLLVNKSFKHKLQLNNNNTNSIY